MSKPKSPIKSLAKSPSGSKTASPAHKQPAKTAQDPDVICIVPLYVVHEMAKLTKEMATTASVAAPLLTYRQGPLLAGVQVFTIFWGTAWQGAQSALLTEVNNFFDYVLTSPLMDQLAEYNVPNYTIGHGKMIGSTTVATTTPKVSVTDAQLQSFLQDQLSNNAAVPKPSANLLYFIYTPPGLKVVQGGSASCQAFCGYHDAINGSIFYAVMPYPGCSGCVSNLSVEDALTSTRSHELCEAITDPVPGSGWYDDTHGEIGDICAWKTKSIGGHVVQLEWSNKAKKCI